MLPSSPSLQTEHEKQQVWHTLGSQTVCCREARCCWKAYGTSKRTALTGRTESTHNITAICTCARVFASRSVTRKRVWCCVASRHIVRQMAGGRCASSRERKQHFSHNASKNISFDLNIGKKIGQIAWDKSKENERVNRWACVGTDASRSKSDCAKGVPQNMKSTETLKV